MTIFNNNVRNSRDVVCDTFTLTTGGVNGKFLMSKPDGEAYWATGQSVSTMSFLEGVTKADIERGATWLEANNKDESQKLISLVSNLNNELTDLGYDNETHKTIIVETPKGFLYLNERISIPDKVNLEFKCFVACGQKFNIQLSGGYGELPPNMSDAPITVGAIDEGDTSIVVNMTGKDNPSLIAGDLIAIRSTELNQRQDNEVSSISVLGTPSDSNFTINLAKPISGFDITNGTVRKYIYALLTTNAVRGDDLISINNATNFHVGQYVAFVDKRKAGDIVGRNNTRPNSTSRLWYSNNSFKYEIRHVIEVDRVGNKIKIESPLSNDYDTTNGYVLILRPRHDSHIKGLKFFYCEEPQYPRNNRHALTMDTCVNCSISDITFSDHFAEIASNVQFPNINNLIRLRETHSCYCQDVIATRSQSTYSASGASYGIFCL
jgi:hypothetical protein